MFDLNERNTRWVSQVLTEQLGTWQFSPCRRASGPRRQLWADPCTSTLIFVNSYGVAILCSLKCNIIGSWFLSIGKTVIFNSFTQVLCFTSFYLYWLHIFLSVSALELFTCIGFQVQMPTDSQPHPPPMPALARWDSTWWGYWEKELRRAWWFRRPYEDTGRRSLKDDNLARKPWISWSGLNPHSPSKSVRAMAISGLWLGSLYTCI